MVDLLFLAVVALVAIVLWLGAVWYERREAKRLGDALSPPIGGFGADVYLAEQDPEEVERRLR